MTDREKVFEAFRNCITEPKCRDCPWEQCEQFNQKKVTIPVTLALDVINLLKEQDKTIKELQNAYGYLQKQFFESQGKLLKEQEAEWIEYPECLAYDGAYSDSHIVCSACKHVFSIMDNCTEEFDYCPHCGAKMKQE